MTTEESKLLHPFLAEIYAAANERGIVQTQKQFGKELCLSHPASLYTEQPSYRLLCCLMVKLEHLTHIDLSVKVKNFITKAVWLEKQL